MELIRRLVYLMGFRPRYGSIFYSPTRAFSAVMNDSIDALVDRLKKILKEVENDPTGDLVQDITSRGVYRRL